MSTSIITNLLKFNKYANLLQSDSNNANIYAYKMNYYKTLLQRGGVVDQYLLPNNEELINKAQQVKYILNNRIRTQ